MTADAVARRLTALRRTLQDEGVHAFVTAHPANVRYLTGFSGSNGLLWVGRGCAHLFTDGRYATQVEEEVPAGVIEITIARDGVWTACREWVQPPLKGGSVAFESEHVSHQRASDLAEWPETVWIPARGWVESLREVKEPGEVEAIRRAARIATAAFADTLALVRPGVLELEIAADLEYRLRRAAPEGPAFETIVLSGERTALPHGRSGTRALRAGDPLLIDFGATCEGYRCDLTRTLVLGRADRRWHSVHGAVCDALEQAAARCRPGTEARDVDAAAREALVARGYGDAIRHGTGHGLGLEVHERPRLHKSEARPLPAGAVVTVEPGLYFPGWGGVRVEDDFHVTANGAECLSPYPRTLAEV